MLSSRDYYHTWVEYPFISDQAPIIFQMDIASVYKSCPFKINPIWLMEHDYKTLFYKVWKDPKYFSETGYQCKLVWKLKDLKQ
jgi:hypothetical protein